MLRRVLGNGGSVHAHIYGIQRCVQVPRHAASVNVTMVYWSEAIAVSSPASLAISRHRVKHAPPATSASAERARVSTSAINGESGRANTQSGRNEIAGRWRALPRVVAIPATCSAELRTPARTRHPCYPRNFRA